MIIRFKNKLATDGIAGGLVEKIFFDEEEFGTIECQDDIFGLSHVFMVGEDHRVELHRDYPEESHLDEDEYLEILEGKDVFASEICGENKRIVYNANDLSLHLPSRRTLKQIGFTIRRENKKETGVHGLKATTRTRETLVVIRKTTNSMQAFTCSREQVQISAAPCHIGDWQYRFHFPRVMFEYFLRGEDRKIVEPGRVVVDLSKRKVALSKPYHRDVIRDMMKDGAVRCHETLYETFASQIRDMIVRKTGFDIPKITGPESIPAIAEFFETVSVRNDVVNGLEIALTNGCPAILGLVLDHWFSGIRLADIPPAPSKNGKKNRKKKRGERRDWTEGGIAASIREAEEKRSGTTDN